MSTNIYESLINKVFINPDGNNITEVNATARLLIEELFKHLSSSTSKPLLPHELSYTFRDNVLNRGHLSPQQILESLHELFDHSMNPYSPYYMGHMDSMSTIYSALGDLIASAINNNMFSLEMSPFLTQLEYKIVQEFCELFGYNEQSGGLILGGGSLANLQALVVARNQLLQDPKGDVQNSASSLAILCSSMAHVSIKKSAMIMGIGQDNVIPIATDDQGHMDIYQLQNTIHEVKSKNQLIVAIVATAGTTITGNIDSIITIAEIARKHSIWLHVDAIWGGGLILSNKYKTRLEGIHLADSITFNPQKWMLVAKTCSLVLYKNSKAFQKYFRIKKDYVKDHHIVTDLSEIGIAGTKRADVLKLWLSVKSMGLDGYELYIDHTMQMIEYFEGKIKNYNYLKVVYPSETAMICMRSEPTQVPKDSWNEWNANLQEYLLKEKNTFMSLPKLNGDNWLRIVLLNPFLNESIIDNVFDFIDSFHNTKNFKECL